MESNVAQTPGQPPKRRYEPPVVRRHENLKDVTLFTNFGPPNSKSGPSSTYDIFGQP
jgi:hypothetical protein